MTQPRPLQLTIVEPGVPARTVAITEGLTLGRAAGNRCRLKDRAVSRYHAIIVPDGDTWYLKQVDASATNPIRVVDRGKEYRFPEVQRYPLAPGVVFRLGRVTCTVEAVEAPGAADDEERTAPGGLGMSGAGPLKPARGPSPAGKGGEETAAAEPTIAAPETPTGPPPGVEPQPAAEAPEPRAAPPGGAGPASESAAPEPPPAGAGSGSDEVTDPRLAVLDGGGSPAAVPLPPAPETPPPESPRAPPSSPAGEPSVAAPAGDDSTAPGPPLVTPAEKPEAAQAAGPQAPPEPPPSPSKPEAAPPSRSEGAPAAPGGAAFSPPPPPPAEPAAPSESGSPEVSSGTPAAPGEFTLEGTLMPEPARSGAVDLASLAPRLVIACEGDRRVVDLRGLFRSEDGRLVCTLGRSRRLAERRGAKVDLEVDHPLVSSPHAAIVFEEGVLSIVDLGSSNGTSLAAKRDGRFYRIFERPLALEPRRPEPLAPDTHILLGDAVDMLLVLEGGVDDRSLYERALEALRRQGRLTRGQVRAVLSQARQEKESNPGVILLREGYLSVKEWLEACQQAPYVTASSGFPRWAVVALGVLGGAVLAAVLIKLLGGGG